MKFFWRDIANIWRAMSTGEKVEYCILWALEAALVNLFMHSGFGYIQVDVIGAAAVVQITLGQHKLITSSRRRDSLNTRLHR